jgi:uncharacterized damage-inducible protein DinB
MPGNDLKRFIQEWDREAQKTVTLLESLPTHQYEFRPWKDGRSLGELAWHLSEVEAYPTWCIETGRFDLDAKPPGIERPREVKALAPGYARVHGDALIRVRRLSPEALDRKLDYFDGNPMEVRDILRSELLYHLIHHRGQLVTMTRLAGGKPPGLFGPNREEWLAMMDKTARK